VLNKLHGSRYFFSTLKVQIRNPIVFSPDDSNSLCSLAVGDPLEEARSIIDRKISRLEESIRALKSRRNELSLISRLPTEILCNIFKFSLIDCQTPRPESWTNFSQVSRLWRSSALSEPELWTNIPLSYPRWTQEMLIRSKKAKLTIQLDLLLGKSKTKTIIETARSCLYEMNRVEEIELSAMLGGILDELFRDLPNKSAPQLHTLCIRMFSRTAFSIHEDFLYDTERLQRVELINCKISWDSRLLTGLTRLTLKNSLKANSSTIIQVLHALRRMPALTHLDLNDSIPGGLEGPSTYAVVDLPCLRVLNILSDVGALTAFLRHISFPHSTILDLTCLEDYFTEFDFTKFLSVLATKSLSTLVIRSLRLGFPDDSEMDPEGLEFHLRTTALIQDCFPSPPISQSQLHLDVTWSSSQPHIYVRALTCAFDVMSLSFLTQLRISTSDEIDSQTWVNTFGKLPLLERVCVQGLEPYSFLEALVYNTKAAEKSKRAYCNVSFPKLRYIHLVGTDFANSPSTSVDALLDYLMERYERNAEIQVLRLEHCCILSDDVERLKEVVVDVIWDRREPNNSW
jgi:F-box-like